MTNEIMNPEEQQTMPQPTGTLPAIMRKAIESVREFAAQKRAEASNAEETLRREEVILTECHNLRQAAEMAKSGLESLRRQLAEAQKTPEEVAQLGWSSMFIGNGAFDIRTRNMDALLKQMALERFAPLMIEAFEKSEVQRHAAALAEYEARHKAVLKKHGAL